MSTLRVANLTHRSGAGTIVVPSGNRMSFADPGALSAPGMVVQTKFIRSDARSTYSSINSGNGNPVSVLDLSITPQFANSIIYCQWMVNCEIHHDNVWLVWKNGALAGNGYNQTVGNIRSSGLASGAYDQNEDSTPSNYKFMYYDSPGSIAPVTYGLAVRSSSAGNYTLALNRTIVGNTADNHESMVSIGIIQEIAV